MPGTAADLGVTDRYNPNENLRGAAQYLRDQLNSPRSGGDYRKALMMYNGGPGADFGGSQVNAYANGILQGNTATAAAGPAEGAYPSRWRPGGSPQYVAGGGGPSALAPKTAQAGQPMSPEERQRQEQFRQQQGQDDRQARIMRALGIARALASGIRFTPVSYNPQAIAGIRAPAVPYRPMGGEQPPQIPVREGIRPVSGTRPSAFESAEGGGVEGVLRRQEYRRG
jgi:hypothetical protein